MPDRTIRESWAIICEDGPNKDKVAGDGGESIDGLASREDAQAELDTTKVPVAWVEYLKERNQCTSFRVARVKLVEVGGESDGK